VSKRPQEDLEILKKELGPRLLRSEQVTPPPGLATGWANLDRYLLWHGFPKSSLSLLHSQAGGATSLWVRSAAGVTKRGQWAAWINDGESTLTPWVLRHRGVDLSKLLCVSQPSDVNQLLWALGELMSLCLFELIGCDLGGLSLREGQLLKLKKLAMRYQTAVVLISHAKRVRISPFYALVLEFGRHHVIAHRALHRHAPHTFERRDLYADTLPLLAAGRRALCG
jgi:hypothetical protein